MQTGVLKLNKESVIYFCTTWNLWIQTLAQTGPNATAVLWNTLQDHSTLMDCCLSQYNVPGSQPTTINVSVRVLLTLRFASPRFSLLMLRRAKVDLETGLIFVIQRWMTDDEGSQGEGVTYTVHKTEGKNRELGESFHSGMNLFQLVD